MLKIKYLGIFPVTIPSEMSLENIKTLADVMTPLIEACKMPEDFFWERHLILLNGRSPELDEPVADGDLLQILSHSEGG